MTESWVFKNNTDEMEIGDTGYVSREDGWMENKYNGYVMDPEGRVYDADGDIVWDPSDGDYEYEDDDDYEWYS